jgi:hypothetical protein
VQDLFSMLSWEYPELFFSLPCQYNYQTHQNPIKDPEWLELNEVYRICSPPYKIIHRNGSI